MAALVTPFLMFQGDAEAALELYLAAFPEAVQLSIERWGPGEPGPEDGFKRANIRIAGQTVILFESPVKHAFGFTPAASLFVECESEAELEALAARLGEGGEFLMPVGDYGFSRRFGWLNDRFGVSWQLNLA
jgi:predicted 3-demethylubiquinone-9 3-methyltransferase (glyoxalase superfamily)